MQSLSLIHIFTVVQSSVEWELLNPSKAFDPSAILTRETVAYTLMNLISRTHEGSSDPIKDLQDCSYPEPVSYTHLNTLGEGFKWLKDSYIEYLKYVLDDNFDDLKLSVKEYDCIFNKNITEDEYLNLIRK